MGIGMGRVEVIHERKVEQEGAAAHLVPEHTEIAPNALASSRALDVLITTRLALTCPPESVGGKHHCPNLRGGSVAVKAHRPVRVP